MTFPNTLDPEQYDCGLHDYHSPKVWLLEKHHRIPLAWTRAAGEPEAATIPLCGTGHDATHVAIRLTVKGAPLPYRIGPRMAVLVEEAVDWWRLHSLPAALLDVR